MDLQDFAYEFSQNLCVLLPDLRLAGGLSPAAGPILGSRLGRVVW